MNALTPEQREIVARLQSGHLMTCDGQGDPNSDGCGGQGYSGAAGQEPCRHCFGVGVMTPELQRALMLVSAQKPTRESIAFLIMGLCDELLEYQAGLGICNTGTVAYRAADALLAISSPDQNRGEPDQGGAITEAGR